MVISQSFFHTQHLDMQILSSVNIMQMLPNMVSSISGDYKQAVQKFSLSKFAWNVSTFHIQFLGKGYDKALTEKETEYALSFLNQEPQNIAFMVAIMEMTGKNWLL